MRLSQVAPTLLVFVSLVCRAQTQFPDTPPGHQSKAWFESFNRGDTNAHREFLEKNSPSRLEHLEHEMEFRRRTGGFDVKRIEESTATKIIVLVQERSSDQFARLTMEVQAEEPHRITNIEVRAIPRPAEFPLPRLSESQLVAAAKKNIEK